MSRFAALLIAGCLSALCGCGEDDSCCPLPSQENAARWYAGDFHVHSSVGSNDTRYPDGALRSLPETIRDVARQRGLSFVVVTDHSNSAGSKVDTLVECEHLWNRGPEFPLWHVAAALSSPDFLMIDGSEISPVSTLDRRLCPDCSTIGTGALTPVGHIGCVPLDLSTFELGGAFTDRPPGRVTGGQSVAECKLRGGLAIVNHPFYRSTPWIDYDWTSYQYDAIEVFNGSVGYSSFDVQAYDAYLCDRLAGRDVVAVGGSDNHRTPLAYEDPIGVEAGPPLGLPVTSILAARLDWPSIVEGLLAGRIVIHEIGTFVEIEARSREDTLLAVVGGRVAGTHEPMAIRLRGKSPREQELRLYHAARGACEERRQVGRDLPPRVGKQVVFRRTVCGGGPCEFEHEAVFSPVPGLYFASVGDFQTPGINARDVAFTNVIEVTAR